MSPQTGAFNLRSSSDAPNLQVENEETIEALSARTKALLERSNSAFILPFAFQHRHASCRGRSPFASLRFAIERNAPLSPRFLFFSSAVAPVWPAVRQRLRVFAAARRASRYDWRFSFGVRIDSDRRTDRLQQQRFRTKRLEIRNDDEAVGM
ncbi:hypothetical protein GWC77_14330 [Paraburkholderia sp. NMBU_R16]|uniref:hypothetical protein n=1 Tax=Paraburkholderia sp. NMBU_R16 TaxID=2698676 RepID=UPI001564B071|nr:hypothetical protein [Paraburkholderia sp. NMBU_R16]NRO97100.1 hypothetical protein [Paraburkholderia sp. NMBU_R16]